MSRCLLRLGLAGRLDPDVLVDLSLRLGGLSGKGSGLQGFRVYSRVFRV